MNHRTAILWDGLWATVFRNLDRKARIRHNPGTMRVEVVAQDGEVLAFVNDELMAEAEHD